MFDTFEPVEKVRVVHNILFIPSSLYAINRKIKELFKKLPNSNRKFVFSSISTYGIDMDNYIDEIANDFIYAYSRDTNGHINHMKRYAFNCKYEDSESLVIINKIKVYKNGKIEIIYTLNKKEHIITYKSHDDFIETIWH